MRVNRQGCAHRRLDHRRHQPAHSGAGTNNGLKALEAHDLDAAILVAPPFDLPKALHKVLLRKEALVFISNEKSTQTLSAQLQTRPYIRFDPDAWGGRHAARYLQDMGLTPPSLVDLDALETIAMRVAEGLGVSHAQAARSHRVKALTQALLG